MAKAAKEQQAPREKVKLTISQVKQDLKDGIGRKEIATKYGLTATDVKRLFENPKLKGLKVKPAPMFELVDDVPDEIAEEGTEAGTSASVANTTSPGTGVAQSPVSNTGTAAGTSAETASAQKGNW